MVDYAHKQFGVLAAKSAEPGAEDGDLDVEKSSWLYEIAFSVVVLSEKPVPQTL